MISLIRKFTIPRQRWYYLIIMNINHPFFKLELINIITSYIKQQKNIDHQFRNKILISLKMGLISNFKYFKQSL